MGRGNCNVNTTAGECVFYVDNDLLQIYYNKSNPEETVFGKELTTSTMGQYEYDQDESQKFFEEQLNTIKSQLMKKFKSLKEADYWSGRSKHIVLENNMYGIALEDNEWSVAFELIMKIDGNPGLKKHNAKSFGKGLRDILIKNFGTIHIRTSAWTSAELTKDIARKMDSEEKENKRYREKLLESENESESTETLETETMQPA